jgi:DNA polymerase-3 subunit gamma/tau
MSYQVIARKWRPQTFEEVTGQEHVTRTLRNAVEHRRLHHSYIFTGVRGVGKTTSARLLAKAVNCQRLGDRPNPTPCRTDDPEACLSCREIALGASMDVAELDAASNTGVDAVREQIIQNVNVRPSRDRYRVFIIDEVHMLSTAAFNALLKTLEEPPARVLFILATTHAHKLPDTIVSRSQVFQFRTISTDRIAERLTLIARAEGVRIAEEAVWAVARAGAGSMRDAQSALDQVISFKGEDIGPEDVRAALGIVGTRTLHRTLHAVWKDDRADLIELAGELTAAGLEPRNFVQELLGYVRDLTVARAIGSVEPGYDPEETARARDLASSFSTSDLIRFFYSLMETDQRLRDARQPQFVLEMGLVKLAEMRRLVPVAELLRRLEALEGVRM